MFQLKASTKLFLLTAFFCSHLFADDGTQSTTLTELEQFKKARICYSDSVAAELWENGLNCAEKSLDLGRKLFSSGHKNIAALTHNYGLMLAKNKAYLKAAEALETTYSLYKKHYGKKSEKVGWLLIDLADSQLIHNAEKAIKNYQKGVNILSLQESFDPLIKSEIYLNASVHLSGSGQSSSYTLEDALAMSYFAYETYLKVYGESHHQTALAAFSIGKISYLSRDYVIAEKFLEKSLVNQNIGKYAHGILVEIHTKNGRTDLAQNHQRWEC